MSLYIHWFWYHWSTAKVHSCAANAGLSIKEVDSVASLDEPAACGCMMCWLLHPWEVTCGSINNAYGTRLRIN